MTHEDDLISWKTQAWTEPGMVAWYAERMKENAGTNRLNNFLETGYFRAQTIGNNILDIGIGTGRASLPLARTGYSVTGIDSSASMLEETRRQAGETPIVLMVGDVLDLPVPDNQFDTVMALNVLTHFPHWREVLSHWSRKAKPGGRIVFDVYSLDHVNAVNGTHLTDHDLVPDDITGFAGYNLRLRVADLVEQANELGLTVCAIIPYRLLFSSTDANRWLLPHYDPAAFEATLASMANDETLLDLALFLEQEWAGHLTSRVTGKFVAVLERREDYAANKDFLARQAAINEVLGTHFSLENLSPWLPLPAEKWRHTFADKLAACTNAASYIKPILNAWNATDPSKKPVLDSFFPPNWLAQDSNAAKNIPFRPLEDKPLKSCTAPIPEHTPQSWHLHRGTSDFEHGSAGERQGTPLLADLLFGRAVLRAATGSRTLWIGTPHRATLVTLAQNGHSIQVIDSQQTPSQVLIASYDLIVFASHQSGPSEWQSWWPMLAPGGRLCALYFPAEHPSFNQHDHSQTHDMAPAISIPQLEQWTEQQGGQVADLFPLGLLNGAEWSNHWLQDLESRYWWQRLLSWLGEDKNLLQFAMLLDENIIAQVPSGISARNFLALEKAANKIQETPFDYGTHQIKQANIWLAWLSGSESRCPLPILSVPSAIDQLWLALMKSPRAQVLCFELLQALSRLAPAAPWQDLLPPPICQLFADWKLQDQLDVLSVDICRHWSTQASHGNHLVHAGVSLAPALAYPLTETLLTHYFGVFSGSRS